MAIYGPCSISSTFKEISLLFSALLECQSLPWTRVFPGVTDRNWNLVEFFWYFKLLRLTDALKTQRFLWLQVVMLRVLVLVTCRTHMAPVANTVPAPRNWLFTYQHLATGCLRTSTTQLAVYVPAPRNWMLTYQHHATGCYRTSTTQLAVNVPAPCNWMLTYQHHATGC